ncbi:MAG: carbamoyltransferase HypF [Caldilineaceae bacterium]
MKPPLVSPASHDMQPPPTRRRLRVRGIVQGVGFRPYVYTLAVQLGLGGFVGNDTNGVFIEIEGTAAALDRFQAELQENPPPLAVIEHVEAREVTSQGERIFTIVASDAETSAAARTFVPPDQALCADCRRELFDPQDRRYRYPFINCTNCGPRYTIIRSTPYDRPFTTMDSFAMCDDCRREYEDPANRRFHAQPIACPVCGPQLTFRWSSQAAPAVDPTQSQSGAVSPAERSYARTLAAITQAQRTLADGKVLAVKGLGGYHLACNAADERAVALLRTRKGRGGKPFAVMAAGLAAAQRIAFVDAAEAKILESGAHPIVLLRKRPGTELAPNVAPGNGYVGVMLPYTPLHELLFSDLGSGVPLDVLVMTSGNLSEEPIVWRDEDAMSRLDSLADAFLLHDRPIYVPCDDSVVRIVDGLELPIRRARGYAPMPVSLPKPQQAGGGPELTILAAGADLKAAFCLAQGQHAVLSQHIGDMGSMETYAAFDRAVGHLQDLFRMQPDVVACDAHPSYLSTRWAYEYAQGRPVITVQHHHAHIAALLAEQGAAAGTGDEPVIGFSFDGTGYGTDGAIWGGEVLLAGYASFDRRAHLRYVPLPGGDAAVHRPYRAALAHLWAAGVEWLPELPPVAACPPEERLLLQRQLATGFNCVPTSSMGRLCDAVAALTGVCQAATYEAQAAIELEALAAGDTLVAAAELARRGYLFGVQESGGMTSVDPAPIIRQVAGDVLQGRPAGQIATLFHAALAELIVRLAVDLRDRTGIGRVALSGGVFQNVVLLRAAVHELRRTGFTVYVHHHVPANDGGLALGQAAVVGRQLLR